MRCILYTSVYNCIQYYIPYCVNRGRSLGMCYTRVSINVIQNLEFRCNINECFGDYNYRYVFYIVSKLTIHVCVLLLMAYCVAYC